MVERLDLAIIPDRHLLEKPSEKAQIPRGTKKELFHIDQLKGWKDSFTKSDLMEMDALLAAFNISIYSAYDPLPINNS